MLMGWVWLAVGLCVNKPCTSLIKMETHRNIGHVGPWIHNWFYGILWPFCQFQAMGVRWLQQVRRRLSQKRNVTLFPMWKAFWCFCAWYFLRESQAILFGRIALQRSRCRCDSLIPWQEWLLLPSPFSHHHLLSPIARGHRPHLCRTPQGDMRRLAAAPIISLVLHHRRFRC